MDQRGGRDGLTWGVDQEMQTIQKAWGKHWELVWEVVERYLGLMEGRNPWRKYYLGRILNYYLSKNLTKAILEVSNMIKIKIVD